MKKRSFVLLAGLVAIVAAAFFAYTQPTTSAAPRLLRSEADVELIVRVAKPGSSSLVVSNIGSSGEDGVRFSVDSFFDILVVSNIGSSGEDGVRFSIDSFFDIFYDIAADDAGARSVPIELVALQLRGSNADPNNPGQVLDDLKAAVGDSGTVIGGHVTLCCPR